jgi:DNA invertase Pin-like site-specific DNA recombinase
VIRDNDRSATRYAKRSRDGWTHVHDRLARGDVDVLVTWQASRAQRDLRAYVELRQLCEQHGVRWAYSGTVYDLSDRQDRFRTGLDALVAEDEAERNRESVLRAMRANAAVGRPHGRLPYGYMRTYERSTGELEAQVPHPEQAPIVREMAERFLAGESTRSIANDLNARNVPPPHHSAKWGWSLTQVRRCLTNPAMNAKRVHRGEIVGQGEWEPILDDETFARLAARFADPARKTSRTSPTVRLLSGVCRCGVCGAPMVYAKQGGFGDRPVRFTYQCRPGLCTARDMASLDRFVTGEVLKRLSAPDAAESFSVDQLDDDAAEAAREVAKLTKRLNDAIAEYVAERISATTLGHIEMELRPQIAEANRRVRVSGLPTIVADLMASDDVEAEWDSYTVEQRREVIRSLVTVVVHHVKARGRRTFEAETIQIDWKH